MKIVWAAPASATAINTVSSVDKLPTTRICQSENTNVTGQSAAHNQRDSLYQNSRVSGVFSGFMFRFSVPNRMSE